MKVSATLEAKAIITGTEFPDLDAVVTELVGRLVACGGLPALLRNNAITVVRERERISSTAMVDIGVSIPHSRLDGIEHIISSLAVSASGVYGAAAGTPISIVALVLSPPQLQGEHLNFLAALSLLLHSDTVRRELQSAPSPEAVLRVVRQREGP